MPSGHRLLPRAAGALLALAFTCRAQAESDDPNLEAWRAEEAAMIAAEHEAELQAARIQDMVSSGLTRSEARFGLELLREVVAADPVANQLVAPLGAFLSLNLAAEAASAPVRQQLDAALHVQDIDRPSLRRAIGTLRANLAARESTQIDVACSVWLGKDHQPAPGFVAVAGDGYGATVSPLDFSSPEALQTINAWAEAGTRGAIPQALEEIDPGLPWLLTTITSFSADWLWPFSRDESAPHAFTDAAGRVSHPVMMHILQVFPYVHDVALGAQIVGLPCDPESSEGFELSESCALYVVLPDAKASLTAVLERLADGSLSWRLAQLVPQSGDVTLPRFEFRSESSLSDALDRLGLGEAAKDSALPGIAIGTSLGLEVRDSNMIIVDEDGPRAVSVMATSPFGLNDQPAAFSFVADRPFIYILIDRFTGTMLFAGVMAHPD